ncbi:MAG: GGDEF domain-containing protein, partial [Oscillospiraceae bacterium]
DLFAQYSSCQYLVMVAQTSKPDVENIAQRIRTKFYNLRDSTDEELILYHSYPLKPVEPT